MDENVDSDDICEKLSTCAVQYAVSHIALTALLCILCPYFGCLPSNARTLLRTPRKSVVKVLRSGGEYCHLGLVSGLMAVIL
jgi:hypothetical protein